MEETTTFHGLGHLFITIFLYCFSSFIVAPVITDISMAALCPGKDECSLAIYLSGFQQVITGVGSLIMMPLVGSLSDKHGRKCLLTLPMTLNILPLVTLAYSRGATIFYMYYVLKTLTSIVCEGSVLCLALAYVADNVPEGRRASAFGILTGITSCAFVCANLSARFLSIGVTFQVAAAMGILSTLYMRLFLPDSIRDNSLGAPIVINEKLSSPLLEDCPGHRNRIFRAIRLVHEMASLMRSLLSSVPLFQVAMVSFFSSLAEAGLHASSMYYLKAKFHFNKDQFADLMIIVGASGSISQLLFMPVLVPALKEERLLSIGLFFGCAHMFLLCVAWSSWVPYMAAIFALFSIFPSSCMRSIVSKQVASYEQGKAQGIISSICSLANVISPLAFSPLTGFMEDQPINQCSSSTNASEKTPESTLELNIKTLDSRTYTFQVNKNETVLLFKEKIASETGVPVGQQRLIFRGRVLKDDHPLSEYHLENGHTLHLIVRQPAESAPSSGTPSQGATANDGNNTNGGPSRNGRHVSHSVVLGSFNVGDQTEGIVPDLSRVIGAVLNSFGVSGQLPTNHSTNGTQSSMPSNQSSNAPPGNTSDGEPGIGGQSQATGHSQPRQAFPGVSFQTSMPRVVQIPVTAATTIPIPSFLTPIPDSLDTLMEFINRMEQALSQNGYQPDTSSAGSGGRPREELPRNRRGAATPEALSVVLRNAQHLLSGLGVSSLSHIAGRLEQDGSSSDPTLRSQIQTEAVQVGLAMQHLGALLLELGRTILTLRMAPSPELSYVNAGPAVYISPSGPNPIMVQPFPHQISPLFTGATVSSNPLTGPVGLGTAQRHINIHIHAGTSGSPMLSSVGNQRSNGEGGQGDRDSNTSSVPAAVPSHSTGENVSAGVQPGLGDDVSVAQINARIRDMVNIMQGRDQIPSGIESLERDMSTGHGVATAMPEQPTNIATTCAPESSSGSLHDLPSERSNSVCQNEKDLGGDLEHPARAKDTSCTTGQSSAPSGDATGDAKETNKATPEVATATPLGLGLGGLDRKKRSKQPKVSGKTEDSGTSATLEGVQQSSGTSGQQLLQSLFSGSSRSDETGLRRGQGSDDRVDVSSAMSQVLESPVLDGLLAGVSRQAGVDSPNMLRNMLQQFTQNPQIMNTVQQIAQQVDGQEIENMMSGGAQGEGGGFDFSRMVQQMMPLVSRAFSQGGPLPHPATIQPDDRQPSQVNVQSMAQMIEHSDPPEDVFRAMVENAAISQDELVNELCCDEALSQEYAELLRRDIEGRLKDDQGL